MTRQTEKNRSNRNGEPRDDPPTSLVVTSIEVREEEQPPSGHDEGSDRPCPSRRGECGFDGRLRERPDGYPKQERSGDDGEQRGKDDASEGSKHRSEDEDREDPRAVFVRPLPEQHRDLSYWYSIAHGNDELAQKEARQNHPE